MVAQAFRPVRSEGCSLQSLERQIVGLRRRGDVPGFEIPARYFQFVRSGDARPLRAVLEHNRLDLLTLAALTARLLDLARRGPDAAGDAREALALGHVYARGALEERARELSPRDRALPLAARRLRSGPDRGAARAGAGLPPRAACTTRRRHAGASWWRCAAARRRSCARRPRRSRFITSTACAIWRSAKAFALRSLESGYDLGWANAARYRLARIERKLEARSLKFEGEV